MSTNTDKKLSVNSIKCLYDLTLDHFIRNTEQITGDETPAEHTGTILGMKLAEVGYQRAANLGAMIKSHESRLKRDGHPRATAADADDTVALLFKDLTGEDLVRPATASATDAPAADMPAADMPGADTPGADTPEADTSGTGPEGEVVANGAPVALRSQAAGIEIAAGAEALIDPTIQTITSGKVASVSGLVAAIERAEAAQNRMADLQDTYRAAITAYEAGETDVDEDALAEPERLETSGYAGLATDHAMTAVLDNMLSEKVEPATSFAELVNRITVAESAVGEAAGVIKALKRDLRRAKPKERVRVAGAQAQARVEVDTLSEIDEINADCEVVMETASDLFPKCYGANPQVLGFEAPRLDFGVAHPEVPAVDDSFRFYTGVLVEALSAIADNEIIWLHGDSGSGKSEFCAQIAAQLNMPFTRINLDGHLTRSDIVGGMKLVSDGHGGSETRFVEGALPRAMSRPGLLLIDEFDLGDPEIMPIFQPVLEGKPIVLLEDGGRIVKPHPMFRIIITGNTIGLGSDNQMYLNAFEQSAATRDRISAFVEMPYMPANIEEEVVMARLPEADPDFVGKLVQLANKVREGYRNQEIQSLFSTRAVLCCARRHSRFAPLYPTPEQAGDEILKTVILNRLDSASHNTVKGLIDNIFA